MTVGEILRTEREARHITIGEISRRTFIQTRFLEAIDQDNLSMVPDSHIRLFVREYARSVGLDPEPVLELIGGYVRPAEPAVVRPSADLSKSPGTETPPAGVRQMQRSFDDSRIHDKANARTPVISGEPSRFRAPSLGSVGSEASGKFASVRESIANGGVVNWLVGGGILLLLAVGIYYLVIKDGAHGKPASSVPDVAAAPAVDSAYNSPGASPTAIVPTNENTPPPGTIPPSDGDSLTLEGRAVAPVWFTVTVDGKRTETGTLDSGSAKVWRASKSFRVSLGNAGGLNMTLNGKSIGVLGPRATAVRNKIIDSSGVRQVPSPSFVSPAHRPAVTPPARSSHRRSDSRSPVMRQITPADIKPPRLP